MLEFREHEEAAAKDLYIEARAARLDGEATIAGIHARRLQVIQAGALTLQDRLALENCLQRLNDDERAQRAVLAVLQSEEQKALENWHSKRREHETMLKMRGHALEAWELDERRKEQSELDEWAVLRSAA